MLAIFALAMANYSVILFQNDPKFPDIEMINAPTKNVLDTIPSYRKYFSPSHSNVLWYYSELSSSFTILIKSISLVNWLNALHNTK